MFMVPSNTLRIHAALLLACLALIEAARAQSSRPGWGSIPYHDASGTGVTFRVWAPNATSVYVPGQFNGWSTTATPLAKELSNAIWTAIWSADITTANSSKFVAAINKLDYLQSLGVNAVEVMPIAEFPGDNSWGYNPSQLFAVENSAYGGADGFKTFVRACHLRGLAVLLDVVHNH